MIGGERRNYFALFLLFLSFADNLPSSSQLPMLQVQMSHVYFEPPSKNTISAFSSLASSQQQFHQKITVLSYLVVLYIF